MILLKKFLVVLLFIALALTCISYLYQVNSGVEFTDDNPFAIFNTQSVLDAFSNAPYIDVDFNSIVRFSAQNVDARWVGLIDFINTYLLVPIRFVLTLIVAILNVFVFFGYWVSLVIPV